MYKKMHTELIKS